LLWGTDPRRLIFDVRRRLYGQFPARHDWASLTTYLSLPRDFEQQLCAVKIKQALESINAAMSHADEALRRTSPRTKAKLSSQQQQGNVTQLLEEARQRMRDGKKRLNDLVSSIPEQKAKIFGLLASTEKRQAQVLYQMGDDTESKRLLVGARDHYWESFQNDRALHWAVVQYLSLRLIVERIPDLMEAETRPEVPVRTEKNPKELWCLARLLSLFDLHHEKRDTRSWAHANLVELYLLSVLPDLQGLLPPADAERLALEHTDQLLGIAGWDSFECYSTRRQVLRYLEWYKDLTGPSLEPLMQLAERIFDRFPAEVEGRY
jgi:hypothetical protein